MAVSDLDPLLALLIQGAHVQSIANVLHEPADAIADAARTLGWTFDSRGVARPIADDTPAGAERSQLDDRPSEANGLPGVEIVEPPADSVPVPVWELHNEHTGAWGVRSTPDPMPADPVPDTLPAEIRAALAACGGIYHAPAWLDGLGLDPDGLTDLLETARTSDRGALRAIALVVLADLADLVTLVQA